MTRELLEQIEKKPFACEKIMFGRFTKLHFVGIGGAGMSGIAEILSNLGYAVSGSDSTPSEITEYLDNLGVRIINAHLSENVEGVDVVVISSAIGDENPEVRRARELGIPVIKRAEMLGELMRLKFSIGVAGTHGKTTTTSMIGKVLSYAGMQPTQIVGGVVSELGTGASLGQGDCLVAEADEYDRSFLSMYPGIAVVLNIEPDHLDCYRDFDHLKESFLAYINRVPFYGSAVLSADDANIRSLLANVARPYRTFGLSSSANVRAENIRVEDAKTFFDVHIEGEYRTQASLRIPGRHNVLNALAAIATGLELRVPIDTIVEALEQFSGVGRRFELVGDVNNILLIDDYAHHPTEIRATIQAARSIYNGRIIAVFQPHLFSRTQTYLDDFASALSEVDHCVLTDIYPAREEPIPGVTSDSIRKAALTQGHTNFEYVGKKENAIDAVVKKVRPGDVVILIGAGSITYIRSELLERLAKC